MGRSISKSKFISGLQCPKLQWVQYNTRELIPEPGPAQKFVFETGHLVGDLAKKCYPDGIEITCNLPDGRPDIPATVKETQRLLPLRKPLFEASFLADDRYVRADILVPAAEDSWDLIEVKSSTKVKDVNLWDVAYQCDCLDRAGIKVNQLCLMHLDNTYVRQGEIEPLELFHQQDITREAHDLVPIIPGLFDRQRHLIAGADPGTAIGPHCKAPYTCPLMPVCWANLPRHHVTGLYYAGKNAFSWMTHGWHTIDQVPANQLSPVQLVQQAAIVSGHEHFDKDAVRQWLDKLTYPLWHLDFETMNPAVPLFDGTRPYQRIPFQFSLHVQDTPGAEPRHIEFLAVDPIDPRPGLLEALRAIGSFGTVLAYNKSFEQSVLAELGDDFPSYQAMTAVISSRMRDLADPFRRFDLYHPDQQGKYSLKYVLPAWTSLRYDDLDITDGQAATRAFMQAVFGDSIGITADPGLDQAKTLASLRTYCGLDTLAMVELLKIMYARI